MADRWRVFLCTPEKNPWCKRKERHAIVMRPGGVVLAALVTGDAALTRALAEYAKGRDPRG